MSFEEKIINSNRIYEGNITNYVVKEVELPNGKRATREIVEHDDAVGILAITDEGKALMVRQYRIAPERELYEIPAGLIDDGETPLQAAKRELEEETGYQAEHFEKVTGFYTSAGFSNEYMTLYLAEGLTKVENPKPLDEDEFVEVYECTFDDMRELHENGKMPDSKTVAAYFFWQTLNK